MTEQSNIEDVIERYRQWLTMGIYPKIYYSSKEKWESEIEAKIKELKLKLKT